jgi:hypothetical protein
MRDTPRAVIDDVRRLRASNLGRLAA